MRSSLRWIRSLRGEQIALIGFLCLLALIGGSSKSDESAQILVRLGALVGLAYAVCVRPVPFDSATKPVAIVLAAACIAVAVQLIPLPYALWSALPGRELYAQQGMAAGVGTLWRPLSLSPDRTWNALLSLIVPLSIVALMAKMDLHQRRSLLPVLVCLVGLSALVVLFRLMTGSDWIARFDSTDLGGSGIFANRNHQALLLVMGFPLLAVWAVEGRLSHIGARLRWWIGGAGAATLVVLIPATGSRTGLALSGLALLMTAAILWTPITQGMRKAGRRKNRRLIIAGASVALVGLIFLTLTLNRAEGVRRLMSTDVAGDVRARLFPRVLEMMTTYFPAGAGYGSFDPAFRRFERLADLKPTYFNQAHNDLLQIVIEGGILGAILLVGALTWLVVRSVRVWRAGAERTSARLARLASFLLLLMIAASVVDYPLRTPLMSALFAIFAVWLHEPIAAGEDASGMRARARG